MAHLTLQYIEHFSFMSHHNEMLKPPGARASTWFPHFHSSIVVTLCHLAALLC